MAEKITLLITKRENVKPSSPTPEPLRLLELSMLDQIAPDMYVPLIFYYDFNSTDNKSRTIQKNPTEIASERLQRLREILSETLTLYYPFAGRLRNNSTVECTDEGVLFMEATATFPMSMVLKNPDPIALKRFLGAQPEDKQETHAGSLLIIQATTFICGGISLGMSFSHKIADASSIAGFLRVWAGAMNEKSGLVVTKPEFGKACNIFPPIPDSFFSKTSSLEFVKEKCTLRRYVFTAEKIASLKSILENNPTRVEAVSALIWKCAAKVSVSKTSILFLAMNLRPRMHPPLGDVVGNLVSAVKAKMDQHDPNDTSVQALAKNLSKAIHEAAKSYSDTTDILRNVQGIFQEVQSAMNTDDLVSYSCTTWCRFGFYETNFGWGNPTWVSVVSSEYKNSFMLMDAKDGCGIEAWLSFTEEDMASVETDPDLLAFASLNPSVV